ncbi:MAG: hypothetical protein PHE33_04000 [Bacteroidales bacterium]|nr:hypothetical protein [Bacteroidales bacterium]
MPDAILAVCKFEKHHLIEKCRISFVGSTFQKCGKFCEKLFRKIGLNDYCSEPENYPTNPKVNSVNDNKNMKNVMENAILKENRNF